ncbi:glycosyltransferase [Subsaxibacter sp. CAU 1640]|uniref:glycosyltransferase n=1 Tax=Subsaxibacter sp. CAU 1640 TaxID=2933271 RepID=UPI002002E4DF|nr:glycosyltransferase [Subsaxibacter sp. CAU 1640]MCK7590830.1 glycosyltransferase [Subsaxibacter sp. CAU 1640]
MNALTFSFIIPVFNRPDEVQELLNSFTILKGAEGIEIIIVEDGSDIKCDKIIDLFKTNLNIKYFFKDNSGPGDSRNFGMRQAKGNYYIILDSDCLLTENYLDVVKENLQENYVDCFGGPDAAHESFSNLQKAINFAMTSFITTGGIRGGNKKQKNFQPRSFNMGISKRAFEDSGGFGSIHPGEDPDLAIRLNKLGYKTVLFKDAFVYHKRRISWSTFYRQVFKFGSVRPILNFWHPETTKITYWFPTVFSLLFLVSLTLLIFQIKWLFLLFSFYFVAVFVAALISTKSFFIAIQCIFAIFIQFFGYGYGFLKSTLKLKLVKKSPEALFPSLFFENGY